MNSKAIVILLTIFSYIEVQGQSWNIRAQNDLALSRAIQLVETDSFYYVLGLAYVSFPTSEQGVFITKINKKTGQNIAQNYYDELNTEYFFTDVRNVILEGNSIIFPLTISGGSGIVHLFKANINTLAIDKILVIKSPEIERSFLFLQDFLTIGNDYYLLSVLQTKDYNEPLITKINKDDLTLQHIRFKDKKDEITPLKFIPFQDGILVFSLYYGVNIVTGGRLITYLDLEGKVIWENKTPGIIPNYYVLSLLLINDHELLINSDDPIYNYTLRNVTTRHSVMRYDLNTNKSVWYTWWDEPRLEGVFPGGRLVKGHKEGEILMMANDTYQSQVGDITYISGKVVKFDLSGKKIWSKIYTYYKKNGFLNNFYNMISTTDGNYLMCGIEGQFTDTWLVKIDEDGNILPIDTVSATVDWSVPCTTSEISIYPNPASASIIINQGEIADVQYLITDMNGRTMQQITVASAHQNTIWDIAGLPCGTYLITMMQNQKIIGQIRQVVIK